MKNFLKRASVVFLLLFLSVSLLEGCRKEKEADELSYKAFTNLVQKKNYTLSDAGLKNPDMTKWKKASDGVGLSIQYVEFYDSSKASTFCDEQKDQINVTTGGYFSTPISTTYNNYYYYLNRFDTVVIMATTPVSTMDDAKEICETLSNLAKKGVAEPSEDDGTVDFWK